MQTGDTNIANTFDLVAHDFGRNCRLLSNGQITGSSANDGNMAGTPGRRFFLDGYTTGDVMVNSTFEFFAQRARVFRTDARHENALFTLKKFGGDLDDLFRRF